MKVEITVLMSVYNGLPYLNDALDSIINQSFKNFEFLIIDDCSNDGSLEILKEYAAKYSQINLVVNKNRAGLGANLKKGVDMAQGQWIARMDADDIAMADRLSTQLDFAKNNPEIDIIGSYATDINEDGEELGLRKMPLNDEQIKKYIWTCPIIHPTAFLRKGALLRAGSYGTEKRRQDYALWFRCAASGLNFANIPQVLLKYRFADEYFRKNNFSALIDQIKIGWRGCILVKAPIIAYIGVTVPLLKALLPASISRFISNILKKFDPRGR